MINILKLRKLQKEKNIDSEKSAELNDTAENSNIPVRGITDSVLPLPEKAVPLKEAKKKSQKKPGKKSGEGEPNKKKNRMKESAEAIENNAPVLSVTPEETADNNAAVNELLGEINEIEKELIELQEESYSEEKKLENENLDKTIQVEKTDNSQNLQTEKKVISEENKQLTSEFPASQINTIETDPAEILRANLLRELLGEEGLTKTENKETPATEQVNKPVEVKEIKQVKQEIKEPVKPIETYNTIQYTSQAREEKPIQEISKIVSSIQRNDDSLKEELKKKANENIVQLVGFMLSNEYYGVDIMKIREIIRMVDITRVPRAPHFIEGVINLRGTVIPVINLRTKVRMPRLEYDKSTRIVIVEIGNTVVGFIVDAVREVLRIQESVLEPPPPITIEKADYITSVAKLEDQLVILMDTEKVLSNEEGKALVEMAK